MPWVRECINEKDRESEGEGNWWNLRLKSFSVRVIEKRHLGLDMIKRALIII